MAVRALRPAAFRGDPDVDDLHAFFQPEHQFAGHTLWTFGTSLKSAYVNSFEFMSHAPVVQLWRDGAGTIQAVSRLSLGTGEWFHQAAPRYRRTEITKTLTEQADAGFRLLSDHAAWWTVRYESDAPGIELLEESGYAADGLAEVYMVRTLDPPIEPPQLPAGVELRVLDRADAAVVDERAMAQVDAFTDGEQTDRETAWIRRSIQHQLHYGHPEVPPCIVAVDSVGSILAFADVFLDRKNGVGEFEPVGTRRSARRQGLAKAVTTHGLQVMRDQGMRHAVVRTGYDNAAAIATYESAGFETTDRLVRFRTRRSQW